MNNRAAYSTTDGVPTLEIKKAPMPTAGPGDVVIKVRAIAMNPADWAMQVMGTKLFAWMTFPAIFGEDIAGTVHSVGPDVTSFKPGDRVLAEVSGVFPPGPKGNQSARGAFQEYVLATADLTTKMPDSMTFEEASVIPLGLVTATCGLYPTNQLGLEYPTVPPRPKNGKTILVWGAATSVGSNAVQLAVASGYEVIATASAKNFDYVKNLGASQVFDYNSSTVIDDVVASFKGKDSAGVISCARDTSAHNIEVIQKLEGGKKHLASAAWLPADLPEDITAKFINTEDLKEGQHLSKIIFEDFLPKALAERTFVAAPKPHVIGKGLESIQAALDHLKAGVSASKVVITLD